VSWNPSGKLGVVTGASSGIGRHLCLRLAAAGCTVIAVARRMERLQALRDEVDSIAGERRGELHPLVGDITEQAVRTRVADTVDALGGGLDLLINNAGVGGIGPFESASEQRLRRIMEVNFFAPVELTRSLLPRLRASGDAVICNIGSVLGHRAVPDKSEYCASKFALHGWSDALRGELAGSGITVTLVSPSTTRSEFFDSLVETDSETRSKSVGSWSPDRVAAATLQAIRKRRGEVILSSGGKLLVYADRVCPPLMNWALKKRDAQNPEASNRNRRLPD
jgi:short-subunit dehydrogenase